MKKAFILALLVTVSNYSFAQKSNNWKPKIGDEVGVQGQYRLGTITSIDRGLYTIKLTETEAPVTDVKLDDLGRVDACDKKANICPGDVVEYTKRRLFDRKIKMEKEAIVRAIFKDGYAMVSDVGNKWFVIKVINLSELSRTYRLRK